MSLTTNGIGLDKRIDELVAAGLTRINISLDTVDRDHFARLTRRDRLPAVFAGIEAARARRDRAAQDQRRAHARHAGRRSGAARVVARNGVRLRFIEQMPLDADENWARDDMVTAPSCSSSWTAASPTRTATTRRRRPRNGSWTAARRRSESSRRSPARSARPATARGSPRRAPCARACSATTRPTCAGCCAAARTTTIADWWRAAMWGKQAGHGMERADFVRPMRSMGAIGG